MKQLFAAAAILAVAVMAVNAQVTSDEKECGGPLHALPAGTGCAPAPTWQSRHRCAPQLAADAIRARPAAEPDDEGRERSPAADGGTAGRDKKARPRSRFNWGAATKQTLLFLSVQQGYALTQPKTRRDLSGSFWRDYGRSVRSLHGWGDGGRFFTNYVAHPMQGSLLSYVQIQNDPAGSRLRFGDGRRYWRSRMKALAWSAVWSTQFEIGPVSQASIGNVGLHGKQTYVDLVMTPTAGTGLLVAEDALDRYVIERLERRARNRYVRIFARTTLNPTRTAANLLRFKKPWHRDAGLR